MQVCGTGGDDPNLTGTDVADVERAFGTWGDAPPELVADHG